MPGIYNQDHIERLLDRQFYLYGQGRSKEGAQVEDEIARIKRVMMKRKERLKKGKNR
jgi:hypothetical protein